jgi:uncharacterized protein
VLILLAKAEKIWISPGYGLEDRLTAGIGGELLETLLSPNLKQELLQRFR